MKKYQSMRSLSSPSVAKRKKGFTLTEIAIVLGIVGLILGAVWSAAKNVYSNVNSTKAVEVASILFAQVRGAYGTNQPTSGDISGAFAQVVFPNSSGNGLALVTGQLTGGVTPTAGFTVEFTQAVGAAYGAYFANTASGVASCNGLVQAAASLPGTSAATTSALAVTSAAPTACTVNGNGKYVCPNAAGETGSVCSSQTAGSTCTYSPTGVNQACTLNGTGYPLVSVFIPYQPS